MDVVKKARPSRVLTSQGGATVSGTDDVRVRLIGGLPAPGIDDLKTAVPLTGDYRQSSAIFIPRGERSSSVADW
jgi:hypothetical protein